MWFTEAYIKTILVKLIFKTFTIENSKKKGQNILPRPGIHSLLFRLVHIYPRQFFQSGTNCLLHRLCRKKKNLTAKKMKRFNLIQK
jgi:hypothetical protein